MQRPCLLAVMVVLGVAGSATAAPVPVPAPGLLKADGSIEHLVRAGGRVVLSGTFGHIGPYVGGGLGLDPRSGARDPRFARFDGQVSDAIADGAGGWYVGGQFLLDGRRRAVAHVLASGALDDAFDSRVGQFVTSLALHGGRLYAGRWFEGRVAAMDAATGAPVTAFKSPKLTSVAELLVDGDAVFVGTTTGVERLDPDSGQQSAGWACQACAGDVGALARSGSSLYVGRRDGSVVAVDPGSGERIGRFAPDGGAATGTTEDRGALAMLVDGDRLLVGGRGLRLGGASPALVALDLTTGAADPGFARGLVNPIHDLVRSGSALLVAGAPRSGRSAPILRLDPATGAYRDALAPELDGPIDALAAGRGDRLFVGGRFGVAGGITTDGVAEVSARTGRLVPGFAVDSLPALAVGRRPLVAGGTLFFPYEQGLRLRTADVAAFSARTGAPRGGFAARRFGFDVRSGDGNFYESVWAVSGDRLFGVNLEGDQRTAWPQSHVRVLDTTSGRVLASYDLPYKGYVHDVLPHRGQLLVAGSFRRRHPDGRPRHLATMAVDPMTGAIDDGFDAHTNGAIFSVAGFRDRLFLSGDYTRAYGIARSGFSSHYDNTGAIVAGFGRRPYSVVDVFGSQLTAWAQPGRVIADPYTGDIERALPGVRPGSVAEALRTRGGTMLTLSVDLPYYSYAGRFGDFALLAGARKLAG